MDRNYLVELFGGKQFPNGDYIIDHIDEIIEHEKKFMEVVSNIRSQTFMTFPVLSYALLYQDGKFVDEEFARWCSDHNCNWYDSNFYIGNDVASLSSCCLDGKQMTLTKSSNGVNYITFEELYNASHKDTKRNFTIFHNGSWTEGRIIRLPKRDMYKITTSNNKELYVTDNHINPTLYGDRLTTELTDNDYLLFNSLPLDKVNEQDLSLTYDQGFLIGMYLVNGGIFKLYKIKNNCYPVNIVSDSVFNFIRQWVSGDYANTKSLNMNCLLQSKEFRKGILDGCYLADDENSNSIYTTSLELVQNIEALITSLGMNSIINVSDKTNDPAIIRGEEFPLYCIKWYDSSNKRNFKNLFIVKNNSTYFKIKSIEKIESTSEYVYCFEMSNRDEPYFTLPNGIITHNCRMVNDTSKLDAFINSIGGTSLSVGSIKVNTINLRRIALDANRDINKFFELLDDRVDLCIKVLDVVRAIIKRNVEKGLLPNFKHNLIEFDKCFSTIGITSLYETIKEFGHIRADEFDNKFYTEEGINLASRILDRINKLKGSYDFNYSLNVENVPAEQANIKLCAKDNAIYSNKNIDKYYIYSNQWIPLIEKCTIAEKVKIGSILDIKCGGGQISHINIQAPFVNKDQAWNMLNYIAKSGIIYFAYNIKISVCENEHGFFGNICPVCNLPIKDTYSRVVGYLSPISSWSKERKKEFSERTWFNLNDN